MTSPKPENSNAGAPRPRAQGELTSDGRRYRRGEGTFEQLHAKLEPFLRQEFRKRRPLPKGVTADDLVQLTLLRIWKSFDQFRDDDTTSLSKWVTTIAASVCADAGRRGARSPAQVPEQGREPAADTRGPGTKAEHGDLASRIEGCFWVLTEQEKTIFRLRVLEDVPLIEIAARLGKPEGTVRNSFFRARQKLAETTRHFRDE
ncbi:MAG: sigma-70 family RNA polymerase sigma factor [Planctomycetes bacterium]|nr:sigma-70 family RNA polymerase sigma factor [Planctomycetota bacterium]